MIDKNFKITIYIGELRAPRFITTSLFPQLVNSTSKQKKIKVRRFIRDGSWSTDRLFLCYFPRSNLLKVKSVDYVQRYPNLSWMFNCQWFLFDLSLLSLASHRHHRFSLDKLSFFYLSLKQFYEFTHSLTHSP